MTWEEVLITAGSSATSLPGSRRRSIASDRDARSLRLSALHVVEWWKKLVEGQKMSLNIKNPKTHELARLLSELTGEGVTTAVTRAIEERLEKVRKEQGGVRLADRLMAIGQDCSKRLREPYKSIDHGEFLYDDLGLPKR